MDHQGFSDGDDTLLSTRNRAFQHEIIILDNTIMREATHGSDGFLGNVGFSRSVGLICTRTNAVNLFV